MKKLNLKSIVTLLKKFVSKSNGRPILQNAHVTDTHTIATNAHQLIKIDNSILDDDFLTKETNLFDPKKGTYVEVDGNYPDTSRIIPEYDKIEIEMNTDDLKRLSDINKQLGIESNNKKNTTIKFTTYDNELLVGCLIEDGFSEFYKTNIEVPEEIDFSIRSEYLNNMLTTTKKILSSLKENNFIFGFNGDLRPITFKTINKEMQMIIMPIKSQIVLNKHDIPNMIRENQEIVFKKKEIESKIICNEKVTLKSVTKKVIMHSGSKNKRVVEYKQNNDYMTYLLLEDVKKVYEGEDASYLMFYAEINGYLFPIGHLRGYDKVKCYTSNDIVNAFYERHNNSLKKEGVEPSKGLEEYFNAFPIEVKEEVKTIEVMKIEYRAKGSGWYTVETLGVDLLDELINFRNVQEYYIHNVRLVDINTLETIEVISDERVYVNLQNKSSKCDDLEERVENDNVVDINSMTYEQAKEYKESLSSKYDHDSKILNSFPKNELGITTDHIRELPEWKKAKKEFDVSSSKLREFNAFFIKKFKKEYHEDRRMNRQVKNGITAVENKHHQKDEECTNSYNSGRELVLDKNKSIHKENKEIYNQFIHSINPYANEISNLNNTNYLAAKEKDHTVMME